MAARMTPVSAVSARASAAVRSRLRDWLVDPASASASVLTVGLNPPSERIVAEDPDRAREWTRGWHRYDGPGNIETQTVRWPSFGEQTIPVRLIVTGADDISRAAGEAARWQRLQSRRAELLAAAPESDVYTDRVAGLHKQWSTLSDDDFARLVGALDWLLAHPDSGLLIRQLPIEGVDTKWLGRHRTLVERLIDAIRGSNALGIRTVPRLVEIAVLDPTLLPGLPRSIALSVEDLNRLDVAPSHVVIVENRETLHALPTATSTIAVHGSGNAVVSVSSVGWLSGAGDILYWGDLDPAGVTIVGRLRRFIPHIRSVMTDVDTLRRWSHLTVTGSVVVDSTDLPLTAAERDVLDLVLDEQILLEQERIPWDWALDRLIDAGLRTSRRPRPIP